MPRQLYLLRHAKSSWDDPTLADHDRPLAPRGRRASKAMGGYLRDHAITPDLVLCSSAARTIETLDRIFLDISAASEVRVEVERDLYSVSAEDLLVRLRRVPDDIDSVMLINHQPAMQALAVLLVGSAGAETQMGRLREKFPTAALAVLNLPGSWDQLSAGSAHLASFVTPKQLADGQNPG